MVLFGHAFERSGSEGSEVFDLCDLFKLNRPGVFSLNSTSLEKWYFPARSVTRHPMRPSS